MGGETFGEALKRFRVAAGFGSLRKFAEVCRYSHVYLWQLETGAKRPTREAAVLCDRLLNTGGVLVRMLADAPAAPAGTADGVGWGYAHSWVEGVEAVTQLWAADAGRRGLLKGAFVASAFALPAVRWLTGEAGSPSGSGRELVGDAHVSTVREVTSAWRRLDNQFGGGHARASLVRFLDGDVAPLLRDGRFDAATGRRLAAATAELTLTTGWAAYDTGAQALAQRYFIQALRLAQEAGDQALGAEVLAAMAHQCVFVGDAAAAVDLARTARVTAERAGVSALVAESHVMEAHGHAVGGDERACTAALGHAERALDAADRTGDPGWIGYFGPAYLAAKFGWCFVALGKAEPARRFAQASLDMDGATYVRGKAFNLTLLGSANLLGSRPDPVAAAEAGTQALTLAGGLKSTRTGTFLGQLADRMATYSKVPQVAAFTAGVRELPQLAGGLS